MNDELKAAVARVRKGLENPLYYAFPLQPHGQAKSDLACLADAYLAEHPADADKPVTAGWLLSLPGAAHPSDLSHRIRVPSGEGVAVDFTPWHPGWSADLREMSVDANGHTVATGRVGLVVTYTTRGAVRRLLAALGATLTPPEARPC